MKLEAVNGIFKVLKNEKKIRSTNNSISRKTILRNKRKITPFPDKEMVREESCCEQTCFIRNTTDCLSDRKG